MKKLLFISMLALATLGFTSCSTRCDCTVSQGGTSETYTYDDMDRSECEDQVDVIMHNLSDQHYVMDGLSVECSHL